MLRSHHLSELVVVVEEPPGVGEGRRQEVELEMGSQGQEEQLWPEVQQHQVPASFVTDQLALEWE